MSITYTITQYAHSNVSIISIYMCPTKAQTLHSYFTLSIDFLTIILLCQRYMQKTLYTAFYFQSATPLPHPSLEPAIKGRL